MKETRFIEQNKKNWSSLEKMSNKREALDNEQKSKLFLQLNDDLAYAKTYYPNRSIRLYLNQQAQNITGILSKARRQPLKNFWKFWTISLPFQLYKSRDVFYFSLIFFILCTLIGVISTEADPDFLRQILGDRYVDMTLENIEKGDPMNVYKDSGAAEMQLGITANNLLVSFNTFILGITFGIGTLYILLTNGVMLGAFQYFFHTQGILKESFLTIWMHGSTEIPSIVVAGAAGLCIAKGFFFPGTYSRLKAIQLGVKRGLTIYLGLIPFIVFAGFVESYITRLTETPDIIRALFIVLSLGFFFFYFYFFPILQKKKGKYDSIQLKPVNEIPRESINYLDGEKSPLRMIQEAIQIFKDHFSKIMTYVIPSALGISILYFWSHSQKGYPPESYIEGTFSLKAVYQDIQPLFEINYFPVVSILFFLVSLGLFYRIFFITIRGENQYIQDTIKNNFFKTGNQFQFFIPFLAIIPLVLLLFILPESSSTLMAILSILGLQALALSMFYWFYPKDSTLRKRKLQTILIHNVDALFAQGLLFILFLTLLFILSNNFLFSLPIEFIQLNLNLPYDSFSSLTLALKLFIGTTFLLTTLSVWIISACLIAYKALEKAENFTLVSKVQNFGKSKSIKGLIRE